MITRSSGKAFLALILLALVSLTSCELTSPTDTDPVDDGDYRNAFTGPFSFTWEYESTEFGNTTTRTTTYDGTVTRVGTNMLDFEYRPGISRRMVIDANGVLSEPTPLGESYTSSGAFTGLDDVNITIEYHSANESTTSSITGARL